MTRICLGFLSLCFVSSVSTAQSGTLKMRFVVDGTVPAAAAVKVTQDVAFCGTHPLYNENLVVNEDNRGIRNIVLQVDARKTDNLPKSKQEAHEHELANLDCRFEPHVLITHVGDTLKITNPDEVGHNANIAFLKNVPQNPMIPAKQEKSVVLVDSEPAPIPVSCNIHPWMRAYIVVSDHPYVSVSDEDGNLTLEGLPVGEVSFRVWHESGKIDKVTVQNKKQSWRRGRFELDIAAGENDLGEIQIPASAFK